MPDLPNFSHFHDSFRKDAGKKPRRRHAHARSTALMSRRSANTCRSQPGGGQAAEERPRADLCQLRHSLPARLPDHGARAGADRETVDFMRKLDVKEIHGYEAARDYIGSSRRARRQVEVTQALRVQPSGARASEPK